MSLEQDGRYFLPLEDRFEPDNYDFSSISAGDTTLALLDYAALNHRYSATVYWNLGYVVITEWVLDRQIYASRVVPIDQFMLFLADRYWNTNAWEGAKEEAKSRRDGLSFEIPIDFPKGVRDIIGDGGAGLRVSGYRRITLSGRSDWISGQEFTPNQSKFPSLQMEQESRFTITGTIGSKISVTVDQDSQRETDLENTINISYTGEEDDVIQKIEAGNTNLSLPGATFVGYSEQVEGLFGIKSQFQIGDWAITAIASQEKGQHESTSITGNTSTQPTEIKDYNYLDLTYFWIDSSFIYPWVWPVTSNPNMSGDSIVEFTLWVDNQVASDNLDMGAIDGEAMPHPESTFVDNIGHRGSFHQISQQDYQVYRTLGWFYMTGYNTLSDNYAIACSYILRHSDGTPDDTVGGLYIDPESGDTTVKLNLIRPPGMLATNPCWEQTWRNVYYLSSTDLNTENIEIEIFLAPVSNDIHSDTTQTPTVNFLHVFGLDEVNSSGISGNDGFVDVSMINPGDGHLIFPILHPFNPSDIEDDNTRLHIGENTPRVPSMYDSTDNDAIVRDHKYVIRVKTGQRQNPMNLGRFNIMENSEVVKLGGRTLQRGTDYRMDYQIGQITFLNDDALNPNTTLTIDFDYEPFFMPEQKALLGARAEYRFGENSWLGGTAIYKSTSSAERRPRIGREPGKAFIWDADLQLDYEVPFITEAVNAIPLIHTEAQSRIKFTAEVAEVVGNPNTKDEAYIDDFEGSKSTFNLEIRRTAWKKSAAPSGLAQENRGHLIWYNPYDKVPVSQIWPQKEVATEDSKTNVLIMEFDPDSAGGGPDKWAGVQRYITTGYHDQSKSMFLEVWVRGNEGNLHFNLGSINEDIDGDGFLDSEDKEISGYRDGILTEAEDVGLDGLPDEEEPGYSADNLDPNGDNWEWSNDDPDNYSKINGTEGNAQDPESGTKPDTEDLNGNNFLDMNNDYYEYTIDLSSNEFEVPETRSEVDDGSGEYWRLYRIPLQDSVFTLHPDGKVFRREEIGSPDWQRIKYARMWIDGVEDYAKIWIAEVNLVGNKWEEESEHLEITTKNTHEDGDYESPPLVTGERSVTTGIMSQEQSLVVIYDNVPGNSSVACHRSSFAGESMDLTLYQALDMWVYFNESASDDSVMFYFKLGRDANNTYEYRTYLDDGWAESNQVIMDFPEMTAFKDQYQTSVSDTAIEDIEPIFETENGFYVINGSPTLTDIRYFEIGVVNPYPYRPISGEIWVDELRVTDVRKEPGWAEKTTFSVNFADLANFSGTIERKDSEFHSLNEKVGTGKTETVLSLSGGFKPDKFAPDRWGLGLPITSNYSRRISVPRLKTGSDISVPDSLRNEETTTTKQYSINITETLKPRDPHWLIGLTFARLSHSVSAGETRETSPTYPLKIGRNWTARQTYDLTPREKDWSVHLTRWMFSGKDDEEGEPPDTTKETGAAISEPDIGMPGRKQGRVDTTRVPGIIDLSLNFAPTTLKFETTLSGREDERFDRYDTRTYSNTRTLTHSAILNTNIVPPITTGFNLTMKRDIGDSAYFRWKHPMVIGDPLSKSISQNVRYTPQLVAWLSQNYEVRGDYQEDTDPSRYPDRFGNVSLNRTFRASWGLKWRQLGEFLSGSGGDRGPSRRPDRGSRRPGDDNPENGEDSESESASQSESQSGKGAIANTFEKVKPVFDNIDDLNFDWQFDDRRTIPNLAERPSVLYQLSLTTNPGVGRIQDSLTTSQVESHTLTEKRNIRTGARLPLKMTTQLRYNYVKNLTINTNNTKQIQTTFPDITLTWNGLGQIPPFKTIASNARANSHYSYEVRENFESDALKSDALTHNFNPLVSVNLTLKPGISTDYSTNLRDSHERNYTPTSVSVTHNYELTHKITAGYSIRGSKGFKLPLIGTLKFENQLTLSLTVQNTTRKTYSWIENSGDEPSRQRDDVEWSFTPSASYNFSRNIQGGMEIKWIDTKDKKVDQVHHVRDVSIWVELKF